VATVRVWTPDGAVMSVRTALMDRTRPTAVSQLHLPAFVRVSCRSRNFTSTTRTRLAADMLAIHQTSLPCRGGLKVASIFVASS